MRALSVQVSPQVHIGLLIDKEAGDFCLSVNGVCIKFETPLPVAARLDSVLTSSTLEPFSLSPSPRLLACGRRHPTQRYCNA